MHLLGRPPGSHEHATDRIGVDADRHQREAIAEICPKSLAQDVDDRLVTGIEDERNRLELQSLDLAFVELCELGDEWKQTAKRLDVARQYRGLGSEILDPRLERLDQGRDRLQLAAEVGRRRSLGGRDRRSRVAGKGEQAVELGKQQSMLLAERGALVFAGVRRELQSRLLERASQFEDLHPVQTVEDRLDLTFRAYDLHLRHGDEHRLTPRSRRRRGG